MCDDVEFDAMAVAEFGNARFKSVFADTLPTDYVNRVWDIFMYEGQLLLIDAQAPI